MKIARVFPERTSATPTDDLAFIGGPPLWQLDVDEVHVSCLTTWNRQRCKDLAGQWAQAGYKVKTGGPAFNAAAGPFVPGLYVRHGLTITSRGCIRRCPYCLAWRREGPLTLLPIHPGYDVLDNNILACPRPHVEAVCDMLDEQGEPARFSSGIDARLVEDWFANRLGRMRLDLLFTAFDHDSPPERIILETAVKRFRNAGLRQRQIGCYVLVGFGPDTVAEAEVRCQWVRAIGAMPFAMLCRGPNEPERMNPVWHDLVRRWRRPGIIFATQHAESQPLLEDQER